MGLAEPRKRLKLSHDPNNTAWTSQPSFGSALMQKSGWIPGTALGASSMPVSQSTASQVKITVKDDTLGLGASLKSRDIEGQRTGLDAFQGLLGRLNAKDAQELKAVEEKIENRKLEMFARGRWGGMVFVRGGVLVQDDPKEKAKVKEAEEQKAEIERKKAITMAEQAEDSTSVSENSNRKKKTSSKPKKTPNETPEQRAARKAEAAQYKQEKKARKEARRLKKLLKESQRSKGSTEVSTSETPADLTEDTTTTATNTGTSTPVLQQIPEVSVTSITQTRLKNGRHLLRGRNIQAKRMAFSDARGLDQIFMKKQERQQEV